MTKTYKETIKVASTETWVYATSAIHGKSCRSDAIFFPFSILLKHKTKEDAASLSLLFGKVFLYK